MSAEVTLPSDREVRVTRTFQAPRQLVWDAHTKPELVVRWMLGPPGWSMPVCEMDVREGGAYLWRWKSDEDGKQFGGMGGVHADESEQSRRKIVAVAVGRSYLAMALCAQYCRFPERDVAAEIGGSETMRICRVGRKRALFHLR